MAKRKRRRWLFITLGIIAVLVLLGVIFGGRGSDATLVFTEQTEARTIQETVSASGKVFPETEVKISSDVSGEIVELYVEEGDSVVTGQLLAKIDPDAYQSQVERGIAQLKGSQAEVANAKAQISSFEAQKAQIQAQLDNAREIYQRNQQLRKEGVISEADFQASKSNFEGLQANLRAAEANIRSSQESARAAQFNVEGAQAALNELRTSLRRTTIYAPVNGIISLLNVEEGERVVGTIQMAGTEMMRLADLNSMEVRVEVSENDIPRVTVGDRAEIEIDAYLNRKFLGTVTQIANSSTTAAATENVLTSDQVTNFEVRIRIDPSSYQDLITPQKPYPFRPGMSATVDILTDKQDNVVSVPIQAVTTREKEGERAQTVANVEGEEAGNQPEEERRQDLREVVFVIQADSVIMVDVRTGIQDDTYIQVLQGLEKGQMVVKGPYSAVARELKAGTKVEVVTEDEYYQRQQQNGGN